MNKLFDVFFFEIVLVAKKPVFEKMSLMKLFSNNVWESFPQQQFVFATKLIPSFQAVKLVSCKCKIFCIGLS